jgi:GNAT superfamily N-acetyltransferase
VDFEPITVDDAGLAQCADLFKACFPDTRHLTAEYLTWFYRDNPRGPVEGFNAIDRERNLIAGHYACLPCEVYLEGEKQPALLAVLSATHPDYQGKGLFPKLTSYTYEHVDAKGYTCVYGVGNALSTPPLVKKVGFQLVTPLDVRVGFGQPRIDWSVIERDGQFRRIWNEEDLRWRAKNIANPMSMSRNQRGELVLWADSINSMIKVANPVNLEGEGLEQLPSMPPHPKLFMGLVPRGSTRFGSLIPLPDVLKPSPLNLVYKPLHTDVRTLDPERISFGFQDFDAY